MAGATRNGLLAESVAGARDPYRYKIAPQRKLDAGKALFLIRFEERGYE